MQSLTVFLILAIVVDEFAHSLCDESSVVLFVLQQLTNTTDVSAVFGLYRTSTSITGCLGTWITGLVIDRTPHVMGALFFSMFGTAVAYTSMLSARDASTFIALVSVSNIFGSTGPITGRVVRDMTTPTSSKAAMFSLLNSISGFSNFLVPPLGAFIATQWFLKGPFLCMAILCACLCTSLLLHRLCAQHRWKKLIETETDTKLTDETMHTDPPRQWRVYLVSRWCLSCAAMSNNLTLLLIMTQDYGFTMYQCSFVISAQGLLCAITSLVSAKLLLRCNTERVLQYGPFLMLVSCGMRAIAYTNLYVLLVSILFDCMCGTLYFPAFDAVVISSIPREYIGRVSAFMETIGMIIRTLSPLLVINYLHTVDHRLPFLVASAEASIACLLAQCIYVRQSLEVCK